MLQRLGQLSYKQKFRLSELVYLFILTVIPPLGIGLQIFPHFSYTLSLIMVNILQIPSIIILYRWYLPKTIFNKRILWFFLLLPLYLIIYDLNTRFSSIIVSSLPVIPKEYSENLLSGNPYDFSKHIFLQNLDYTFLIILTALGFVLIKELFQRQHTVDQLKSDKLELELNQLKAQIHPHFFFNTLNNLYALSIQGSPKTSVTIANLSGIMRYVLYESQQSKVLLAKEIGFMKSFIDLERIRHADEEAIQFSIQGNPNGILIEPLLFLPLIENCFKHSLQKKIPGNVIRIVMAIDEQELTFQTSNLIGDAVQYAETNTSGGIGLKNVQKRLQILYPDKHQLLITDEKSVFTVTLSIQLTDHDSTLPYS